WLLRDCVAPPSPWPRLPKRWVTVPSRLSAALSSAWWVLRRQATGRACAEWAPWRARGRANRLPVRRTPTTLACVLAWLKPWGVMCGVLAVGGLWPTPDARAQRRVEQAAPGDSASKLDQ